VAVLVGGFLILDGDGERAELTVRSRRTDPPDVTTSTVVTTTSLPAPSTSSTSSTTRPALPSTTTRRPVTSTTSATSPSAPTSPTTANTRPTPPTEAGPPDTSVGVWRPLPPAPIEGRAFTPMVWDGHELLVLGGGKAVGVTHDTAAFNPVTGTWRRLADAPLASGSQPMPVWTGKEAILWGGQENETVGLAYDPATDGWRKLPPVDLDDRSGNTLVWTGEEAIVWGGLSNRATDNRLVPLADGAAYNPATNRWRLLSPAPLDARLFHTAVWTGHEMIIWGGTANSEDGSPQPAPQGAAYNPRTDTWRVLPESPLSSRGFHSAVWTGTEMIVAGGSAGVRTPWVGDTAAYNPTTDQWETLPSTGAHREEAGQAVWTGRQLIIYSGSYGYSYDPAARRWTTLPALTTSRSGHRLVWTGTDVLIFGGWLSGTTWYNDGGIYRPGP
jgi:N-acetylneuraminic acid mutarotase